MTDRYEFRITCRELQYLDPISGKWRRLVRANNQKEIKEVFEAHWRDIRYTNDDETTGTFMAFA
jgi:hypothetical protein